MTVFQKTKAMIILLTFQFLCWNAICAYLHCPVRHCIVPETLTTILIEKCHYVMIMRWCGQYKMLTTQKCRLSTKRRLRRKTVFFYFLVLSRNRRSKFIFHIIFGNMFFFLKWAKNGAKMWKKRWGMQHRKKVSYTVIFNTTGHVSILVSCIMLLCNIMRSSENTALKALKLATLSGFPGRDFNQPLFYI